ncbi:MAG: hypothetical protein A2V88_08265 [Elusimicrobia bacterium RBG_16_66_12]|nr:MAG: hypothetical protein A2V88_08265 [Elusimicrobia bacterium RBG_16_66_12]
MVPVLLLNPRGSMHKARPPRRPTRKKPRKAYRRRRNPSMDLLGALIATAAGVGAGLGAWALQGQDKIGPMGQTAIVAGVGVVGGTLLSGWSPRAGLGLVGAGAGIAGLKLASELLTMPGGTPSTDGVVQQMAAIRAQLGAVQADLGAIHANIGARQYQPTY